MTSQTDAPYVAADFSDYIRETLPEGRYIVDGELFDEIVNYANREIALKAKLYDIGTACRSILKTLPIEEIMMLLAADVDDPAGVVSRALKERQTRQGATDGTAEPPA